MFPLWYGLYLFITLKSDNLLVWTVNIDWSMLLSDINYIISWLHDVLDEWGEKKIC